MAEFAIFERDKKESLSGSNGAIRAAVLDGYVISWCEEKKEDVRERKNVTAKRSNLFPFSLSHGQSRGCAPSVQGSFSGYPIRRLLACGTRKLSFHRRRIAGTRSHQAYGYCWFRSRSPARCANRGKSFGLKLRHGVGRSPAADLSAWKF